MLTTCLAGAERLSGDGREPSERGVRGQAVFGASRFSKQRFALSARRGSSVMPNHPGSNTALRRLLRAGRAFLLLTAAVCAEGAASNRRHSFTSRVEALALLQTLNARTRQPRQRDAHAGPLVRVAQPRLAGAYRRRADAGRGSAANGRAAATSEGERERAGPLSPRAPWPGPPSPTTHGGSLPCKQHGVP